MFEKYRWRNRILVFLADDETEISENKQILIKSLDGLLDRDLIIFGMGKDGELFIGDKVGLNCVRQRFSISLKDNIILFGKDGAVKATWEKHVNLDDLFKLIDSMPMRKREMQKKVEMYASAKKSY